MSSVSLVEVGPRDGFQSVGPFIPTDIKTQVLSALHAAGLRRVEATSFVSPSAVPQLADAAEVVAFAQSLEGLDAQVLVPTERQAQRALAAGARHIAFVLSVSERHNQSNVRRSPSESAQDFELIASSLPSGTSLRLNLATAFDCPYAGKVPAVDTLDLLDRLTAAAPAAEIALCDTTGRVTPDHVQALFSACMDRFPGTERWAFHAHDTYGLGAANVLSAWHAGVRIMDASVAALGGCPFAPGATGNVATEDLVWMFEGMGIATGVDLDKLVAIAETVAALPGAQTGGRVRDAVAARRGRANRAC